MKVGGTWEDFIQSLGVGVSSHLGAKWVLWRALLGQQPGLSPPIMHGSWADMVKCECQARDGEVHKV